MFTISLIAAGLVAVAAVLMTRPAPAVRTADERGITLQTLIVTAVLVLMAVAAGVVIVAITRSASDDLEDQTSTVGAHCNQVEVYDAQLAAAVVPGENLEGRAPGSGVGCVPVCTLTYPTLPSDEAGAKTELEKFSKYKLEVNSDLKLTSLVNLTQMEAQGLASGANSIEMLGVAGALAKVRTKISGKSILFATGTSTWGAITAMVPDGQGGMMPVTTYSSQPAGAILENLFQIKEVRVAANQSQCHAYDVVGDIATIFED